MNRKEIYQDIQETLGLIPTMFRRIPDAYLEDEWHLFKRTQLEPGGIPTKFRALIGLGIAVSSEFHASAKFYVELARLSGASEDEIEEALEFAHSSIGWNAYLSGHQTEPHQLESEFEEMFRYMRSQRTSYVMRT